MSSIFYRGQELKRGDLNIFLKTRDGSPKNAAEISYSIIDYTSGVEVLVPPSNRIPINPAIGEYYASFLTPLDANLGKYRVRWFFREYTSSPQVQIVQEFNIIGGDVKIVNLPGSTAIETDLIRSLRVLLRDNNPGRNYHFSPPTGESSINQYTRVFGFIWEDEELLEFLRVSNDAINMYPPQTFYSTLDQLITNNRNWRTLLLTGGMVYAIQALTLNWILDEFDYTIGGVSLSIEKSSKYQSVMNDANTRFLEFMTNAKETVKVIRGLKHSKFGVGIRSSFGPSVGRGSLTPRRFLGF
jgi:hypothetical protein